MTSIFDKASWQRLGSLIGKKKDNQVQNIWLRAIQLDEVSAQSKEIRTDISQLHQEVKELTKLLKSQTS